MKALMKYILSVCLLCFSLQYVSAQEVSAFLKVDTNQLKLGEQTRAQLIVKYPLNLKIKWPQIPDTLGKIEILQKSARDTLKKEADALTERQIFTITGFDSGFYVIPPFAFTWKKENDTTQYKAETEALLLSVKTIPVDTTKNFRDIKKPLEVPFNWIDTLPYIGGGILLILLVLLIIYLVKNRKKPLSEIISKTPKIPAHETALLALKALEQEKLWQSGAFKAYYSGISDIVRTYIEGRFNIMALELTTDETMQSLKKARLSKSIEENLRFMLELSDLVKFAKVQPIASENENSLKQAYDFVNLTIPKMEEETEAKAEEVTEEKEDVK
jgi:hypothetical protein